MNTSITNFWKQLAKNKSITKADMAALCLFRALKRNDPESAKVYLNKAFKPITCPRKIANGAHPRYSLWLALCSAHASSVAQQLTSEERDKLKELAASLKGYNGEVNL